MKNTKRKINPFTCRTNGSGLWSKYKGVVRIKKIAPDYVSDENFCAFYAHFYKSSWSVDKYGLIYTDNLFIKDFQDHLISLGLPKRVARDIDYTEQGMQGRDFVSLELGKESNKFVEWMGWSYDD